MVVFAMWTSVNPRQFSVGAVCLHRECFPDSKLSLSVASDQPLFIHSRVFTIILHDENKYAEHVGAEFLLPR